MTHECLHIGFARQVCKRSCNLFNSTDSGTISKHHSERRQVRSPSKTEVVMSARELSTVLGPVDADMEFLIERLGALSEVTKDGTTIGVKDQEAIQQQIDELGPRLQQIEDLKRGWGDLARELERIR